MSPERILDGSTGFLVYWVRIVSVGFVTEPTKMKPGLTPKADVLPFRGTADAGGKSP